MTKKKHFTSDDFYEKQYDSKEWIEYRQNDAKMIIGKTNPYLKLNKNSKVLDVGCGSGDFGGVIIEKYKSQVHGVDLNEMGIKKAQKLGVDAVIADLEVKWPWKKNTFDAIFAVEILEHLVETDFFLTEIKRVLKSDGYLILTTPNLAAWFNRILLPFGYQPFLTEVSTVDKTIGLEFTRKLTPHREPVGHLRVFTYRALKGMLDFHGFDIVKVWGIAPDYLPKYMQPIDKIFSKIPGLSSDVLVIASPKK